LATDRDSDDSELTEEERKRRERERGGEPDERSDAGDARGVDEGAESITDEIAQKYDPERLLGMVSKSAGKGQSLDQSIRAKYERRFGVDLGHVRVYTGEFAEEFNKQRSAHAVTIGSTGMILMGGSAERGMHSAAGQALLAHELTHVAQAEKGLHRKSFADAMPFAGELAEHEHVAESVEAAVHAEHTVGSGTETAQDLSAQLAADEEFKAQIEMIKLRVQDLLADAFRQQMQRAGTTRRA
jgi:hypothetical protein